MIHRALLLVGLAIATGCPGDDEQTDATTVSMTSATTAPTTTTAETGTTASSMDTTAGTSSAADCEAVEDEAACAAAENLAEGGSCTWMPVFELSIDGETCNFTPTGLGACVGTTGLDDGCNQGFLCDSGDVEAYYIDTGMGTWEMAQGRACRGIDGFMQCTDTMEAPCTCACEIPAA